MGRGNTLEKVPFKPGEVATATRTRDDKGRWLPGQKNLSWRCDMTRTPTEDDLALIEQMAADGHGQHGICRAIPIHFQTWQKWLKDFPEVREAFRAGLSQEEFFLVRELRKQAEKGAAVPCIFLLKARHGYVEGQAPQTDQRVQIAVTLPAALPADQYKPGITVTTKAIEGGNDDG
jgi:hypothetical protein